MEQLLKNYFFFNIWYEKIFNVFVRPHTAQGFTAIEITYKITTENIVKALHYDSQ